MLTLEKLKDMQPHEIISSGETENSPDGIYMTPMDIGRKLRWVAKRGEIHDWAIYITWASYGLEFALTNGDKITSQDNIKKLVPCDDEAFNWYRL